MPIAQWEGKALVFNNGVVDVRQGETSLVDENKVAHIPESGNVEIDNLTIIKNADDELEVPFDNNTIYRDSEDGFIKANVGAAVHDSKIILCTQVGSDPAGPVGSFTLNQDSNKTITIPIPQGGGSYIGSNTININGSTNAISVKFPTNGTLGMWPQEDEFAAGADGLHLSQETRDYIGQGVHAYDMWSYQDSNYERHDMAITEGLLLDKDESSPTFGEFRVNYDPNTLEINNDGKLTVKGGGGGGSSYTAGAGIEISNNAISAKVYPSTSGGEFSLTTPVTLAVTNGHPYDDDETTITAWIGSMSSDDAAALGSYCAPLQDGDDVSGYMMMVINGREPERMNFSGYYEGVYEPDTFQDGFPGGSYDSISGTIADDDHNYGFSLDHKNGVGRIRISTSDFSPTYYSSLVANSGNVNNIQFFFTFKMGNQLYSFTPYQNQIKPL